MTSVIICTYNRSESLRGTLESLAKMEVPADLTWELIVVDNNSADNTRGVIEEFIRTSNLAVRYIFEGQQGLSHARNRGIRESRGEIIAFTDDDVRVSSRWLTELDATFNGSDCMAVAGRIIAAWDGVEKPAWLSGTGSDRLMRGPLVDTGNGPTTNAGVVLPWGANMAFRKSAFREHGLFRTDLGVSGSGRLVGEDTEFGRRLISAGETVAYSHEAVVFHPVDKRRLTKAYFLSWSFNYGRSCVREDRWPEKSVLWFGIPRYMFRELLANYARWVTCYARARRFRYKVQVYSSLGQIAEARRIGKEGWSVAPR
jgi:glycosyltransferase involved in cell wall biosynthesis